MHLRPINPADRLLPTTPPITGANTGGAVAGVSGVPAVRPVSPPDDSSEGRRFDPSRTGVDLAALLRGGADELVPREQPSAVALATVLERARAALVRGDPGDALAALDEAWDGAMRTEGGWYYRAAALALLGLPGEADRVLQQALIPRGGSVALLFLQSVVRSGLGDARGARDALASAQARLPAEPVLQSWNAILFARAGDRARAQALLSTIPLSDETSTLLAWARQAVTSATVNATRSATPWSSPISATPSSDATLTPLQQALQTVGAQLAHGALVEVRRDVRGLLQSVATGGTFDQSNRPETLAAVRSVLAAVLGVMAVEHGAPEGRAFDARTDPHGRWHITPSRGESPVLQTLASPGPRSLLLRALRGGDIDLADALLHKLPTSESASIRDALRHLVTGARRGMTSSPLDAMRDGAPLSPRSATPQGADGATASLASFGDAENPSLIRDGAIQPSAARIADSLITPLRVGLSLLLAQSQRAEANAAFNGAQDVSVQNGVTLHRTVGSAHEQREAWFDVPNSPPTPSPAALFSAAGLGAAMGSMPLDPATNAAAALALGAAGTPHPLPVGASGSQSAIEREGTDGASMLSNAFESGKRLRALALGCMALAFAAMLYGYGAVAIALAGGASWLALRSSAVAAAGRRTTQGESGH
jgi:hypothetical protein